MARCSWKIRDVRDGEIVQVVNAGEMATQILVHAMELVKESHDPALDDVIEFVVDLKVTLVVPVIHIPSTEKKEGK